MLDGLFRREVLDAQSNEWLGTIRLSSRPSHWAFTGVSITFAIAAIAFLACDHFTRRETVAGELVPSLGLINATATTSGTVIQTFVQNGAQVRAGQPIVALSVDIDSPTIGLLNVLVMHSLQGQISILQQNLSDQTDITSAQRKGLADKLTSLQAELSEINGQITIQKAQISTADVILKKFNSPGANGFVTSLQMQQQQNTVFSAQEGLKQLNRTQDEIIQQIDDTKQQLSQLPLTADTDQNNIKAKLADIEQSLAKAATGQSVIVRAPVSGTVSAIAANTGTAVSAGQPVVSISPTGSKLIAQLLVPSSAIGFIHPASHLKLRYDAFPYQEFGQAVGTVTDISGSALTPSEVAGLDGQNTNEQLYIVDVALDRQTIETYGQTQPLRPGLKLQASIMLDRRRLIQWVFEPIYDAGRSIFGGIGPSS